MLVAAAKPPTMIRFTAAALLAAVCLSGAAFAFAGDAGLAPELVKGLELRARHGIETASSPSAIHVRSQSVHHVSREASTIAMRDGGGRWTVSQVSEDRPGTIVVNRLYVRRRTLPAPEGIKLDRLLASRRLYAAQAPAHVVPPYVGAYVHVMQIVTPKGRTVVRWTGEPRGRAGKVAALVMGWAEPAAEWEAQVSGQALKPAGAEGG